MYRHCIFCSADLGRNQSIEHFPVGRSLAFDAWKGRLWVTCPACARWNLSPLEERWEAVEEADRHFRDARLRVQRQNIGLARLPDGTRLIRVGEALPGELAAWRYGGQLVRRRQRYLYGAAGAAGLGVVALGGMYAAGALTLASIVFNAGNLLWQTRQGKRLVYRVDEAESPTGESIWLRRHHLNGARLAREGGDLALVLPDVETGAGVATGEQRQPLVLRGTIADSVLGRAMVTANERGAPQREVDRAVTLLAEAGGSEAYLHRVSERDSGLGIRRTAPGMFRRRRHSAPVGMRARWRRFTGTFRGEIVPVEKIGAAPAERNPLRPTESLALEMALHEESERRAVEGELALLEAAWRDAEQIAAIADTLLDDPLRRLGLR